MAQQLPTVEMIDNLTKELQEAITAEHLENGTLVVIADIKSGTIPDETPVSATMNIGQMKMIPEWEKNPDAITHLVAVIAARALTLGCHHMTGQEGIPAFLLNLSITDPDTYAEPFNRMMNCTNEAEIQVIRKLCGVN